MRSGTISAMSWHVRGPLAVFVVAACALASSNASADIFQYTDPSGVIHFTNARPSDPRYKVYIRGADAVRTARPGVVPFGPQDRDPARYGRYDEWIRQACSLYQIPEQLV